MPKRFIIVAIMCAAQFPVFAAGNDRAADSAVIAMVDGKPITLAEFERKQPTALFQARNSFYEAEKKAVDDYIEQALLARQAEKEGVTIAELLERHVNSTIAKDPDDAAVHFYFEGLDVQEPYESVKPKIIEHVRERRIAKARAAYIQSLRASIPVSVLLTPPRTSISLADTPVRGPAAAPLTLVEYADYECPYCQQMQPDLDKFEAEYKGRLEFAYKDVPLPMHPHAQKAAEAAHCAGLQNKYWEFHDYVFKTRGVDLPELRAAAHSLGLDEKAFNTCLDSGSQANLVKSQLDEAEKLGLQGTPGFFLNGRFFSGIMTYDQLRKMADDELSTIHVQQADGR